MIRSAIAVINDFSGGQDTKTPIISMGLNKSPNMRNFHCAGVKERLMKRGGFAKVNSFVVPTDDLDVSYPPGYQTTDYPLRTTATYTQISQGFKPNISSTVTKVKLWLKKTGTPAGTDTLTLEIQTDSTGIPSGAEVTNGVATAVDISDTLTTSYAWVTFTFATNPTLVAGTQYHLVLQGAFTVSSSNYVSWGADNYDVIYPDGTMSKWDGYIWTADVGYNACFEVYITDGAKGNDGVALFDFSSKGMLLGIFGGSLYKMDKSSAGTPDGTWDGIASAGNGDLDYMEYSSDANAQTAYVSSDPYLLDQSYSETNRDDYTQLRYATDTNLKIGNTFTAGKTGVFTQCKFFLQKVGSPTGNIFAKLYATTAGVPSGTGLATSQNVDVSTVGSDSFALVTFTFFSGASVTNGTVYAIMLEGDYTLSSSNHIRVGFDSSSSGYTGGVIYIYDASWVTYSWDVCFYTYVGSLQSYSESTIKSQGDYSLKGFALASDTTNKTLTRTIGSPVDLSDVNTIKFDIYASRTGANIKIGIYDATVPTTTEKTYTVLVANTWETVTWDISAVTNANKNAISKIIITIIEASDNNTFYIDNMYGVLSFNFTSSRFWTFGDWQSGRALINTDIGLYTYTGSGNASAVSGSPPIGKFMTIWRNFVFIAGIRGSPNTVRYSDVSTYATWTAANTLNFDTNDGDVIIGMRILKGKLFIFKRYSVHRISYLGSNPTFQVDPILGIGSPSHYCIKEVDMGGDLGTVLVFLTTDKKLAIFDGYSVQVLSDVLTEESNDLFAAADDQPLSFADMNLKYVDLFHAVVKQDTYEYILYCVLGTDTAVNYAFVLDYRTGGIYPYDNQIFASSCYAISTNKSKLLYCAGYTGYMWQMESGNSDDDTAINAYWVSGKIKPALVSLATKALALGLNLKEVTSASTLNLALQYRIDWNVSWTTAENHNYDHNDELAFGKTSLSDIGTVENMLQIKISNNSKNPAPTIYGIDLFGIQMGLAVEARAVS